MWHSIALVIANGSNLANGSSRWNFISSPGSPEHDGLNQMDFHYNISWQILPFGSIESKSVVMAIAFIGFTQLDAMDQANAVVVEETNVAEVLN